MSLGLGFEEEKGNMNRNEWGQNMLGNTFVQVAINFFGRFNIFPLNPPCMKELGTWKARKEVGKISPNWHTTQKDGEFLKRGSKEDCVKKLIFFKT
jgi:hypothetical protein